MLEAIKYGLRNLTNPNGRDARQTFWYWVLAVVLLQYAGGMLVAVPMMIDMFGGMFTAIRNGAPPEAMQAQISRSMADSLESTIWVSVILGAASLALLAMSLVRRLHDSDLPGWIALGPLGIYAAAIALMPAQMDRVLETVRTMDAANPPSPLAQFEAQGFYSVLTYLPMLIGVVIGLRKSSPGPNRYGEAPVSF